MSRIEALFLTCNALVKQAHDGEDAKELLATARDRSFVVRGASNDSLHDIGTEYSEKLDSPPPSISFNQNSILPTHLTSITLI